MTKGIIITLPRYDDVTEYISQFSKYIIDEAKNRGILIKELKDKEVTKVHLDKILNGIRYKMVIFNGHGSESCIFGHKGEKIMECNSNEKLLSGRIIYARSCDAASKLGKSIIEHDKTGSFIGYELPFVFYHNPQWEANPLKDNVARIFLEPSNAIPISIIKGNEAGYAHHNGRKLFLKNMRKSLLTKSVEALSFAEALWTNYIGQVIYGNEAATL